MRTMYNLYQSQDRAEWLARGRSLYLMPVHWPVEDREPWKGDATDEVGPVHASGAALVRALECGRLRGYMPGVVQCLSKLTDNVIWSAIKAARRVSNYATHAAQPPQARRLICIDPDPNATAYSHDARALAILGVPIHRRAMYTAVYAKKNTAETVAEALGFSFHCVPTAMTQPYPGERTADAAPQLEDGAKVRAQTEATNLRILRPRAMLDAVASRRIRGPAVAMALFSGGAWDVIASEPGVPS